MSNITIAKPQIQPNLTMAKPPVLPNLTMAKPKIQPRLGMASPVQQPNISMGQAPQQNISSVGTIDNQQPFTPKMSLVDFAQTVKAKYPQYKDVNDEELAQRVLEKYPQYADKVSIPEAPVEKQDGFFKTLGKDIVRTPIQVAKGLGGAADLIQSKFVGDPERKKMLEERGIKMINNPTFGQVPSYSIIEGIGKGAELGSYAIGGGGAKKVIEAGLKGAIKQGAFQGLKTGVGAGATAGFGFGLQEPDPTIGSVAFSTLVGGLGGGILGAPLGATAPVVGRAARPLVEGIFPKLKTQRLASEFQTTVDEYFNRAFKPSTAGKKTAVAVQKASQQHALGVASILDNIPNEGALPKTVNETLQATVDTKKTVWKKAEDAAVRAGQQGAEIDLNLVANEVEKIANDPRFKLTSPSTTDYAADLALRLRSQGKSTPSMAEDLLADFNARAKTFFQNPNPNDLNNIKVDALVSNALRGQLVDIVEKASTIGYGALRKQYGALAELEKILTRRSLNLANKNAVTFYEGLGNILGAGDVLSGVLNFSPTQIAKGLITKQVGSLINKINDPDRLTAKLFKESYKVFQKVRNEVMPPVGRVIPPRSDNLLPAPKKGSPQSQVNVPMEMPASFQSLETGRPIRSQPNQLSLPPPSGINSNAIQMPSRVTTNSAEATVQGLKRVGGVGSRRSSRINPTGKELGKPGQILSPRAVSDEAYRATVAKGGVTISLEGNKPAKGYAYSPYKEAETIIPKAKFTPEDVYKFREKWYNKLKEKGNHLGIWEDKGNVYLDITKVGEPTEATIKAAENSGQLAVFDLEKFETINTKLYEKTNRSSGSIQTNSGTNGSNSPIRPPKLSGQVGKQQLYSAAPGSVAGVEKDEQGNIKFNPSKAAAGMVLTIGLKPGKLSSFKGFKDITLKTLEKLKGRSFVSKQFISDLTNSGDLKQAEREIIRRTLEDFGDNIPVKEFANKVKTELLPLEVNSIKFKEPKGNIETMSDRAFERLNSGQTVKYEHITLSDETRGPVANYKERIYQSPIKTSAGDIHFREAEIPNYFAHTRIEDMIDPTKDGSKMKGLNYKGNTRRVIELQSDLFQKGNLGKEKLLQPEGVIPSKSITKRKIDSILGEKVEYKGNTYQINSAGEESNTLYIRSLTRGYDGKNIQVPIEELVKGNPELLKPFLDKETSRISELAKLEPYRNTWHERIIKEEVKQAAKDGKTKLQFPTGETAMKIEGLGAGDNSWFDMATGEFPDITKLKVGQAVQDASDTPWIITDVLGDGKFKAVPKSEVNRLVDEAMAEEGISRGIPQYNRIKQETKQEVIDSLATDATSETFDISGKVDTENPIYKFYEKEVGKYLKNKYGATQVTDPQGVKWWEVSVNRKMKNAPIEAFGLLPLALQKDD